MTRVDALAIAQYIEALAFEYSERSPAGWGDRVEKLVDGLATRLERIPMPTAAPTASPGGQNEMSVIYARFEIYPSNPATKAHLIQELQEKLEKIRTRTVAFDQLINEEELQLSAAPPANTLAAPAPKPTEGAFTSLNGPTAYTIGGQVSRQSVRES